MFGGKIGIAEIMWIAIAVSLDACAVALCIGLNEKVTIKNKIYFPFHLAFSVFISFLGGFSGKFFSENIASGAFHYRRHDNIYSRVMMIKKEWKVRANVLVKYKNIFSARYICSIDSMIVGFATLGGMEVIKLLIYTLRIGLVTLNHVYNSIYNF